MFDVGLPEIAVLLLAALFIFGPERLPAVVAQAARTLRQIRAMAAGARAEIDEAIGPELRDFNPMASLSDLAGLRDQLSDVRDLTPRKILNDAMFGADPNGAAVSPADDAAAAGQPPQGPGTEPTTGDGSGTPDPPTALGAGPAQPPAVFDSDAT